MEVFEKIETFRDWDEDYYPPLARWYYDRAVPRMIKSLEPKPDSVILDAGCGPGVHSVRAAKLGFRVHAVDISTTVIEEARRRAEAAGVNERVTFEQADLTRLQFADASFDCVFSWGVIIHIPDIAAALHELARVVKPGGRLALQVTNRRAWDHKAEWLARNALRKPGPPFQEGPLGRGHWYTFEGEQLWVWQVDPKGLIAELDRLGLRLLRRATGELTEIQMRLRGFPRSLLLALNNAWYAMHLPPGPACTNVYTFEKRTG